MANSPDHHSPLGVSVLLEELEAEFSPVKAAVKKHVERQQDNHYMSRHAHSASCEQDFISDALSTLICDLGSNAKEDGVASTLVPSAASSPRGSSLWSGSQSSSSRFSASPCRSVCSRDYMNSSIPNMSHEMGFTLGQRLRLGEPEVEHRRGNICNLLQSPAEELVRTGYASRMTSDCRSHDAGDYVPCGMSDLCSGSTSVLDDDDIDEEYVIQEARTLSLQPLETIFGSSELNDSQETRYFAAQKPDMEIDINDSGIDFDEELDYQEARALSLQPLELVIGVNDSIVDFDDEYEFQEARALSMQPPSIALGLNDSSVDFDGELDFQEARALSMQRPDLALMRHGNQDVRTCDRFISRRI